MKNLKVVTSSSEMVQNDYVTVYYNKTDNKTSIFTPPIPTRWYNGDTLIKELNVVGVLTSSYKETACTRCEIGNQVTSINGAFSYCERFRSVTIPDSVTSIGVQAFQESGLMSINIPDSVTSIQESAFYNCSGLTSVTIGNSVTSIGSFAFDRCSGLTSIVIPDSVTSIGVSAIAECVNLLTINIPNSIANIGQNAFGYCIRLTSITYNGTKEQWNAITKGSQWKSDIPSTCKVHCTDGDISIADA